MVNVSSMTRYMHTSLGYRLAYIKRTHKPMAKQTEICYQSHEQSSVHALR